MFDPVLWAVCRSGGRIEGRTPASVDWQTESLYLIDYTLLGWYGQTLPQSLLQGDLFEQQTAAYRLSRGIQHQQPFVCRFVVKAQQQAIATRGQVGRQI